MDMPDFYEKLDIDFMGRKFPELFEAVSDTADGKYAYIGNITNDYSVWSKEAVEYFGLPGTFMKNAGEVWASHIAPEDVAEYLKDIQALFKGEKSEHNMFYRARNKYGEYVTCSCKGRLIRDDDGNPRIFAGTIVNYEMNDTIDSVTGLYTHNNLIQRMENFSKEGKKYYLALTGFQRFSYVNSTYGYKFGNKVLKAISDIMIYEKREGYLFRTEGVKLAYLIESKYVDYDEFLQRCARLKKYAKEGISINGINVSLELCSSVIYVDNPQLDVNAVYNSAIYALAQAKEENRQTALLVDDNYFEGNKRQIELLSKIRGSIKDNQKGFFIVYQPIVDAASEKITSAEALLRWQDEKDGIVWPNRYIGWLEQDTLFYELGNWIIKKSLEDMLPVVKKNPDFIININLAYPQLQRPEFEEELVKIINEVGFPMGNIKLELTERCRVLNLEYLKHYVEYFNSLGIRTAIDDFGTGYSALNLMVELPVNQIKIDKSFVDNIQTDSAKQSLLKAITTCADELKKQVCIEGVESEELACFLRDNYKVTFFQGFYYDRPLNYSTFMDRYFNQ